MLLDYTEMPKEGKQSRFAYLEFREHGMTPLQGILDFFSCAENQHKLVSFSCVCVYVTIYISLSLQDGTSYILYTFWPFHLYNPGEQLL